MKRENANTAQTLGYALIGRGGAGRAHAGWAADTEGVAVRGFCDIHERAAQQLQAQHSAEYATTDPERVFADPAVDVVSIATSHSSHADLAVAAWQAGNNLFLEKPLAMTTADCLPNHKAMQAAGTKRRLNFPIRFSGAARALRKHPAAPKVSHSQCMMSPADLNRLRGHPVHTDGRDDHRLNPFRPAAEGRSVRSSHTNPEMKDALKRASPHSSNHTPALYPENRR